MSYVYILVRREVRAGRIVKPLFCSACDKVRAVFAHHDDYAKPLEVRWLCKPCHRQWHVENGPGLNYELADIRPRGTKEPLCRYATSRAASSIDFHRQAVFGQMLAEGKTLADIGREYGLSRERVRQIAGSPFRYRDPRAKQMQRVLEMKNDEIVSLRAQGFSVASIGKRLGIPVYYFSRLNVQLPERKHIPKHGTINEYRRGCRCAECRKENCNRTKKAQDKRRAKRICVACGNANDSDKNKSYCKSCVRAHGIKYNHTSGLSRSEAMKAAWVTRRARRAKERP